MIDRISYIRCTLGYKIEICKVSDVVNIRWHNYQFVRTCKQLISVSGIYRPYLIVVNRSFTDIWSYVLSSACVGEKYVSPNQFYLVLQVGLVPLRMNNSTGM